MNLYIIEKTPLRTTVPGDAIILVFAETRPAANALLQSELVGRFDTVTGNEAQNSQQLPVSGIINPGVIIYYQDGFAA